MKVAISDFDLTLFRTVGELSQDIDAIRSFQAEGNIFVINTGRNITSLVQDTARYGIPFDYAICGDGTKIFNSHLEELYSGTIDPHLNQDILKILNQSGCVEEAFIDDGFQFYKDPHVIANTIVGKMLPEKETDAQVILDQILKKYPTVHGYLSDHWINLLPASCNKRKGIDFLCQLKNWKKEQIYTIGDNVNDIDMIQHYQGYSMTLSYPELDDVSRGTFSSIQEFLNFVRKQ